MDSNQSQIKQSADRIRENAKCWSLEGDAEFLRLMSNISNNLIVRGNKTTLDMHKMALQLSTTSVGLNNVTNKLLALQNSQFIENRVREEDDCLSDTSGGRTEVDASPKELPLSQHVHDAFQSGVKMMDKFYDRVTYNFDDSDDETGGGCQKSVLYLPKNVYKNRSLPYIIGSKEWQENRHIGITNVEDISKDGDVDDLQGSTCSLSSSDTSNRSVASDTTENESHFEDADQLFDEKESSSDPSGVTVFKPPPVNVFPETSSSKKIEGKPLVNPASASLFRPENFPPPYVSSNLFDDEPPEISDAVTERSKEYKPANLFADDSDENIEQDQIASPVRQENRKPEMSGSATQATPLDRKPVNLFADNSTDDDEDQKPSDKKLSGDRKSRESEPKTTNLFARNSSDDEHQFSTKSKANIPNEKTNRKTEEVPNNKKPTNLFAGNSSDDDDQLFASKFRAGVGHNKNNMSKLVDEIKNAVGSGNKIILNKPVASKANVQSPNTDIKSRTVMPKSTNLFAGDSTDEDENDPLFSSKVVNIKKADQSDKTKSAVPRTMTNLFADSDSDDGNKLFSDKKVETQIEVPIAKSNISKPSNLFAENIPPKDTDLKKSGSAKPNESKTKLFEDVSNKKKISSSEQNVAGRGKAEDHQQTVRRIDKSPKFGDKRKQENNVNPPKKIQTSKTTESAPAPSADVNIFKSTNLFGDDIDDDYDLFAPKSKLSAKTTLSNKTTVREDIKSSDKNTEPPKTVPQADFFQSSNIFGEDSDSDDGLFAPKISSKKESPENATPTQIPVPKPTMTDSTIVVKESNQISPVPIIGEIFPEDKSVVEDESEIESSPVQTSKTTVQSDVSTLSNEPAIGEKYNFLNSLLGEGPPDESFDIFKASKSEAIGRSMISSDNFDDEKNSLFSDDGFLGPQASNSNEIISNNPQTIDTPETEEKKTYGNYSSLHLFSDEPPDDDDNSMFSSESIKNPKRKLIGVFDDSNNAIGKDGAGNESISNEGYSYMLFANEPPPFDSDEKASDQQQSLNIEPDVKKILNERLVTKNLESSSLPKDVEDEPLNANRASLPTTPSTSLTTIDIPKEKEREISAPASSNLEVATTLDSSLTKSRAKFSKPRRRSTRHGRQQQYEKYLASPEEEQITEIAGPAPKERNTQDIHEGPKDPLPSASPKAVKPKMYNLSGNQKELQSKIVSELKKRTSKLFQDTNEDDTSSTDWLSQAGGKNQEILTERTVSVVSAETHNVDKDAKEKAQEKNDKDDSATLGNTANTSQRTAKKPNETSKNVTTPLLSTKIEKKKPLSLFGDESSDEDFFDNIKRSSISTKKASSYSTVGPKPTKSESISVKKDTQTTTKPAKLFTSSEDDDDALFSTKSKDKLEPKKAVVATPESRKVVPVTKKIVKTASMSTAVENPLADLFD